MIILNDIFYNAFTSISFASVKIQNVFLIYNVSIHTVYNSLPAKSRLSFLKYTFCLKRFFKNFLEVSYQNTPDRMWCFGYGSNVQRFHLTFKVPTEQCNENQCASFISSQQSKTDMP